jgi:site-specific recombinase XerD
MTKSQILAKFDFVAPRRIALTTERSYRTWIVKYLEFLESVKKGEAAAAMLADIPDPTSEDYMEAHLSTMAHDDYSSVSQDQAFNAILFLYRHVIKKDIGDVSALRCRKKSKVRYVPSQEEISRLFAHLENTPLYNVRLHVALLYACGLRIQSTCELRIKDFDLDRRELTIHSDKGDKDRKVPIPESLIPAIRRQIARASALAQIDIAAMQPVQLPGRLDVKYPAKQFEPGWHFLFPSPVPCPHPRTKKIVRWCIGADVVQRAFKKAVKAAGLRDDFTPHCLRHAYCTYLLDSGHSPRRVQEAMGHSDIRTTMGYARPECLSLPSPIDALQRKSA